jgi:hypothetical protein
MTYFLILSLQKKYVFSICMLRIEGAGLYMVPGFFVASNILDASLECQPLILFDCHYHSFQFSSVKVPPVSSSVVHTSHQSNTSLLSVTRFVSLSLFDEMDAKSVANVDCGTGCYCYHNREFHFGEARDLRKNIRI